MDYNNEADTKSELSFTLSEKQENPAGTDDAAREMMNMALAMQQQENAMDPNHRRIESKDTMWKPAPIVGREPTAMRYGTQQLTQMQNSNILQPNAQVLGNQA